MDHTPMERGHLDSQEADGGPSVSRADCDGEVVHGVPPLVLEDHNFLNLSTTVSFERFEAISRALSLEKNVEFIDLFGVRDYDRTGHPVQFSSALKGLLQNVSYIRYYRPSWSSVLLNNAWSTYIDSFVAPLSGVSVGVLDIPCDGRGGYGLVSMLIEILKIQPELRALYCPCPVFGFGVSHTISPEQKKELKALVRGRRFTLGLRVRMSPTNVNEESLQFLSDLHDIEIAQVYLSGNPGLCDQVSKRRGDMFVSPDPFEAVPRLFVDFEEVEADVDTSVCVSDTDESEEGTTVPTAVAQALEVRRETPRDETGEQVLLAHGWDVESMWEDLRTKGKGALIGLIDGGVDVFHPDLGHAITEAVSYVEDEHAFVDATGHGTHAAGILVGLNTGIAPDASLHVYRVLDNELRCDLRVVAQAIHQAVEDGCNVLSLSLGGQDSCPELYRAVLEATWNGVVLVCAATNEGRLHRYSIGYPARYGCLVCVGSHTKSGQASEYSSVGREIDFLAPGEDVQSLAPDGNLSTPACGTSVAVPFVAGLAVLLCSWYDVPDTNSMRSLLREMCTSPGHHDESMGYGVLSPQGPHSPLHHGADHLARVAHESVHPAQAEGVKRKRPQVRREEEIGESARRPHRSSARPSTSDRHTRADHATSTQARHAAWDRRPSKYERMSIGAYWDLLKREGRR